MKSSPFFPNDIFNSQVPSKLLIDITKAIYNAYSEAYEYCSSNYDWHQVHDILPLIRKANIERNVLHCVKQHSYVNAKSRPNEIKNCYHVLIRCSDVILTISAVSSPGKMVREAIFRKQYAMDDQISLFPDYNEKSLNRNLYGIILHKPSKKWPLYPEFLMIRFPDASLSKYLGKPVDLTKYITIKPQEVIDKPQIKPRKISITKDDVK